jgi:phosphatidylserine/phosphatidylglycerophosphate/cardiolipin synthase-like enzyme
MKPILFLIIVVGAIVLIFRLTRQTPPPAPGASVSSRAGGPSGDETHYSPFENLEALDYRTLAGAKQKIDIAMYSMTDRYLVAELTHLADQGVAVRIYRDGEQWQEEMRNGRGNTIQDLLRPHSRIQIRVKPPSRRDLMHLKAYVVDGSLLRDGSANWSPAGLKVQDNDARFTSDPREIEGFETRFDEMWKRTTNLYVQ